VKESIIIQYVHAIYQDESEPYQEKRDDDGICDDLDSDWLDDIPQTILVK